jgi:amino acid permease
MFFSCFTSSRSFVLGLITASSGHFLYWFNALQNQFWSFFACFLFFSSGMLCLTMCLAEINSCLPFSGGSYGFSRITLSGFIAFLSGVCDRINLTAGFARTLYLISLILVNCFQLNIYYHFLFYCLFSVMVFVGFVLYRTFLWEGLQFLCLPILILLFLIILFCCFNNNFNSNVSVSRYHHFEERDDVSSVVYHALVDCLPVMFLFYHGIETIPFTANEVHEVSGLSFSSFFCNLVSSFHQTFSSPFILLFLSHERVYLELSFSPFLFCFVLRFS